MHLTDKQVNMLAVLREGNTDKSLVDLDQFMERLTHKPSKESIHFSIRALVNKELIEKAGKEKRRGRLRTLLNITELGLHFSAPVSGTSNPDISKGGAAMVVSVEEDSAEFEIDQLLDLGPLGV